LWKTLNTASSKTDQARIDVEEDDTKRGPGLIKLAEALATSQVIVAAAAVEKRSISVAVCDELGRIHAFLKMDGSDDVLSGHEAMRRAIHAASTGNASSAGCSGKSMSSAEAEGIGGSSSPGGVPSYKLGELYGSVGVAGTDPDGCVRLAELGAYHLQTL
jgi:uncharacterized protein GlcG (DUF336 family)